MLMSLQSCTVNMRQTGSNIKFIVLRELDDDTVFSVRWTINP